MHTGKAIIVFLGAVWLSGCGIMSETHDPASYRGALHGRAIQGDAEAQYRLGKTYCCGYDATRSTVKARVWFCRAAVQGHPLAQYELGRLYELYSVKWRPRTGTQDVIQSHMWYSLAAEQGNHMAALNKATLEQEMSQRTIAAAQRLKSQWRQKACSDVGRIASH